MTIYIYSYTCISQNTTINSMNPNWWLNVLSLQLSFGFGNHLQKKRDNGRKDEGCCCRWHDPPTPLPRSHIAMEHPSFVDVIMSYWTRGNSFAVFVCFRVLYKKCDHWTVANSCKVHKLVVLNFSTHLRIVIQIGNHLIWTRGKDDKHLKPQSKYSISGLSSWCLRACFFFQADLTVPNWAEKLKTPITTRRATVAPRENHSASKFTKTC